jgi:hypothetical protein
MMQMVNHCDTYYINPFAANVKAVKDARKIEVWKPIFDRLANKRPVKEGADIEALLTKLVDEIAQRDEQEQQGDFTFLDHPIFVFVDELPEVFARCPDAIKHLDRIGRTGRQYCVFAWIASQTALVSEIGQSTAAQANYKTRIYGGGDKASSNRLMKGTLPPGAERTLQASGAGLTLMLADGVDGLAFVRAPLVTNEALFAYFGLPPFSLEDWLKRKPAGGVPSPPSTLRVLRPDESTLDTAYERRYARTVTGNDLHSFELETEDQTPLRYARNVPDEAASEAAVRAQDEAVAYPAGWDHKKVEMLPGFYRVLGLDKALVALELSTSQRNRDFARSILKQQGVWKEAR